MLKRVVGVIAVLGFAVGLGLILAEPFVRQHYAKTGNLFMEQRERYIDMRELTPNVRYMPEILEKDGKTRQVTMAVDENGFIRPSKIHEEPDFSMVFLGGSTTECAQVEEQNRFPYLVGHNLEKALGKKINSYNAGRSANNTFHANLALLAKVIPLKPKFAVIMHNVNDIGIVSRPESYWGSDLTDLSILKHFPDNMNSGNFGLREFLRYVKNSLFPYSWNLVSSKLNQGKGSLQNHPAANLNVLKETNESIGKEDLPAHADFARDQFVKALKLFIATSRIYGIEPILLTQGHLRIVNNAKDKQGMAMLAFFNEAIKELGQNEGVNVIDIDRHVSEHPEKTSLFYDSVHYRDAGSRFIAGVISDHMLKILASGGI